jgi:hypothetical protein
MSLSDQCILCDHYRLGGSCGAFNKIPTTIITGAFDHRKAYPGDRGVRWSGKREEKP